MMSLFSVPPLQLPTDKGPTGNAAYLYFEEASDGSTTEIRFDVVLSEIHEQSNAITDHPVEQGADITDHVKSDPDRVTLECFVTNHPIHAGGDDGGELKALDIDIPEYRVPLIDTSGAIPTIGSPTRVGMQAISDLGSSLFGGKPSPQTIQFPDGDLLRTQKIYNLLSEVRTHATLLHVITSLRSYENMILEHFNTDRSVETGSGVTFSLALRFVNFVSTQTVSGISIPVISVPRAMKALDAGKKGLQAPNISMLKKGANSIGEAFTAFTSGLGVGT